MPKLRKYLTTYNNNQSKRRIYIDDLDLTIINNRNKGLKDLVFNPF